MSDGTGIEWADATWNPVTGCTRVSPGCAHCYIDRSPPFRIAGRRFELVDGQMTTGVTLHRDRLDQPKRWTRSRRIFVNSLSDLFHESIDYHYIREVFNTMRCCDGGVIAATGKRQPSHIFQVLTKRPERALQLFEGGYLGFRQWPAMWCKIALPNLDVRLAAA